MAIITAIKPQKNKKRVNVYLDGKFAFGLDLENLLKFGLKAEQELTDQKVGEIVKEAEFTKISDALTRFASFRPRSEKEVDNWFKRKKVYEGLRSELKKKLRKLDFLDDRKFAAWWVRQRISFRPKGKKLLSLELRQKGIDKNIIEDAFADEGLDEISLAKELIKRKAYRWEKDDGFERKKKIQEYLSRRGFDWETIKSVLK